MFDKPTGRRLRGLAVTAAMAGLTACTAAQNTVDAVTSIWSKPLVLPCPDYRILADAARIVQFRAGPGRDLVDVDVDGRIGDLAMECTSSVDRETNTGTLEVGVTVAFGARRGPANATKQALLPYFLSVTDQKRNVLYHEEFQVAVDFPGNQSAVQFTGTTIKLELPITPKISSRDYVLYAGFKLNRDQLDYNRRTKGQSNR